ncbi:MAG TPA: iron-sulfur cluster assembly scaffold protein [bacterium (Candidatus Stahlbacteria)]|nr:iron-sulfur cluster assembly scaffold protein [Candidatus Stahlbacteria bacterium]
MADDLDKFVEELQQQIMEEVKRSYTNTVIDHWIRPRNWGILNNADGYGKVTGSCGDTMEIYLKVRDNKIVDCSFNTDGCGITIACGSMVTELIKGKELNQLKSISQHTIIDKFGGLPEPDQHCALLAANTLHAAIRDYERLKKEAWRKFYRKC